MEKERAEQEEQERLEKERAEQERKKQEEQERLEKERAEQEEQERLEKERAEQEEQERLEKERAEQEEQERLEKERADQERKKQEEQERLEKERAEQERKEQEEKERLEKERVDQERKEQEEQERLEKERTEQERKEQEEQEHLEKEREEREERERLEKERAEREEQERLKKEQRRLEEEERKAKKQAQKEARRNEKQAQKEARRNEKQAQKEAKKAEKPAGGNARRDRKQAKKAARTEKKRLKREKRKRIPLALRVIAVMLQIMICLGLVCFAGAAGYVGYVAHTSKDIDPENIYSQIDMSTFLYDSKGREIDKIYYSEDREFISFDEIPENTKNAFIAIEDKTFYSHHGFNFRRMAGAVISKLLGKSEEISGTSTITQQLARNVFLADVKSQRSIRRKVSEMLYAWKIEQTLSKDEILEAYLNTIYLGYGSYGIETAARTYFDKDVRELDLAESAALAALPQAPDSYALLKDEKEEGTTYLKKYDVYANDASKERRDLVLDLMVEQEYITEAEAAEAKVDIKDILKPHRERKTSEYTYFSDYVINKVAEDLRRKYMITESEAQRLVYTGGLHIRTTVDSKIQKIINEEFENDWNFPWSEETPQAAMVVTEVGTGRIKAMVGGRGASGKKLFNRATSPRQPGSSIKPLSVYSAALQKSYECEQRGQTFPFVDYGYDRQGPYYWGDYITASSLVIDERMYVNGELWPQNYSRTYSGRQSFRSALQQSLNTCAVKIQLQVGADYSMDILKKFGITTAVDDTSQPVNDLNSAALGLGAMTYGVTPLEMAEAYAVFPNGGERYDPVCYTKVTDSNGNVILTGDTDPVRVLDEGVAYIMTDCLKSVVSRGIAGGASIYGVQVGGKTGTTNDTADIWFCGFTPEYSAALWIGTDHNSAMSTTSSTAAYLWSRIMSQVPDITEGDYREMPSNVVVAYGEYYTEGTVPAYGYYYGRRRRW